MTDRGWAWLAIAAFVVLVLLYPLYGFPKVENDLTSAAEEVASFQAVPGAEIAFNGRDGYLSVPDGVDRAQAAQIAADIGEVRGVRDVELGAAPALDEAPAGATEPSEFEISWVGDRRTASGVTSSDGAAAITALAGADGIVGDEEVGLSPEVAELLDRLVPEAGAVLTEGAVTVSGDEVRVTGVAPSPAEADELTRAFRGVEHLSLAITSTDAEPARFEVAWDGDGASQTGVAPDRIDDVLSALGVEMPALGDVTVTDEVGAGLGALADLVGPESLAEGVATVTDGDSLRIAATAANRDALDQATGALDGLPGVELDLELSAAADAQSAIDGLLALEKIEFVSGTATPTAETEELIGRIAAILDDNPQVAVDIVGHTDALGDAGANQALSEWRAHAVLNGLVAAGVESDRLTAEGRGETEPIDSNDTADGRQRNRRVELSAKEIG